MSKLQHDKTAQRRKDWLTRLEVAARVIASVARIFMLIADIWR